MVNSGSTDNMIDSITALRIQVQNKLVYACKYLYHIYHITYIYMLFDLEVLVINASQVDFRIVENQLRRNVHIVESLETFTHIQPLKYTYIHQYMSRSQGKDQNSNIVANNFY